jgi:hypothetical protein
MENKIENTAEFEVNQNELSDNRYNRYALKGAAERLLRNSRIARCHRFRIPKHKDKSGEMVKGSSDVVIYKSDVNDSVFYTGLETCGSVWSCPLCAAKISERRRSELNIIMEKWKAVGGIFYLMTMTFPHTKYNSLSELLNFFSKARKRFFASRTWRNFSAITELKHMIYCLEVTHGNNGWHIHLHSLMLMLPCESKPESSMLLCEWQRACVKSNLKCPNEHGLDIRDGKSAGDYISKWGFDLELTKQHIKNAKKGSSSPFDLLRQYFDGDSYSGKLFIEFSNCFKGKRQLIFSRNLRKELCLGKEKSDLEICQESMEDARPIYTLTRKQWVDVIKSDSRYLLLEVAREYGANGIDKFLKIIDFRFNT